MKIRTHKELDVYQIAFDAAMQIFTISKTFPKEEGFSLTDQIRRSSRSVCTNISEAYRKRKYPKSFIAKLADSEGDAAETQVWFDFANKSGYLSDDKYIDHYTYYDNIIGKLINMTLHPEQWIP
jgi:four helix bundle protein